MFLKSSLCRLGLLAGLLVAAPLWAQNTISVSCGASGAPGATVGCDVTLSLASGVSVDTLDFGLSFAANGGAPAPATKLKFTDSTASCAAQNDCASLNGTTPTAIAPVWTGLDPVLTGSSKLGTVTVTIPSNAVGAQTYTATLTGVSASFNSVVVPVSIVNGVQTITVPSVLTITSPADSTALAPATAGAAYTAQTITASGGTAPYTWSTSPSPVDGLTIGANGSGQGVFTGSATTATGSPFSLTVTVTDHVGATAHATYTLPVNAAISAFTPASLPAGTEGAAYNSGNIVPNGGTTPYTFSTTASLATYGLSISSTTGAITGTPTSGVTALSVPVTVTDVNGATFSKTYSLTISGLAISGPTSAPDGTVGLIYNGPNGVVLTASGGTGAITWTTTSGSLPAGLTFTASGTNNATGTISGTPTAAGASTFTLQAKDSNNITASVTYTITIYAAVTVTGPATLPTATVGSAYSYANNFTVTGGKTPISYSAAGLPKGVTINASTGVISGTPGAGTNTPTGTPDTIQITVTDANGATAQVSPSPTLQVNPALTLTPTTLTVAIPAVAYSKTFTAGGGSGSGYTLSAAGLTGTGLSFNASTGVLSGTPLAAATGNHTVTVTVTDSIGATANFTYTLTIAPPLLITTTATPPAGILSAGYAGFTVAASGGSTPYTWTATGLPPGLSIGGSTGTVTGTPSSVAGSPYTAAVKVTDANGTTATSNFTFSISALPLVFVTGILPAGEVGVPYPTTAIIVHGGAGIYTWKITGLPPGLTTDGSGDILGTPTSANGSPFTVTVTVSDASNLSLSNTYSLVINNTLSVAAPATLPGATLNAPYTPTTILPGGGIAPFTWAATGLPAGMSINIATGVISGTPTTAAGTPYSVTVTVTDSTGKTASMTYSLAVASQLTITGPATLPVGTLGGAYTSTTITAAGGSPAYTWSATGLPTGLSIDPGTGIISGTPTGGTAETANVTVTVSDTAGATATKTYTLTVNPAPGAPTITGVSANTEAQSFIAPNTWITIYGTNFTTAGFTDTWTNTIKNSSTGALPTILDNVSAMVGGVPAYVYYLSATQIDVLTANIGFGPLAVTVTNVNGTSNAYMITSQADIPGFFEWPNAAGQTPGDTSQQPVATHFPDGTDAAANGTFSTATVPAKPGETIILWGSGFGTTSPVNPFGVAIPTTGGPFVSTGTVSVTLNNAPITVVNNSAFLTPGSAGLFQVAVTIPSTLANGTYPITVTVNGVTSPTLSLAVHN